MEELVCVIILKKNWKKIIPTCFLLIFSSGIFTLWQLGLMHTFDAAAQLNLRAFLTWIGIEIAGITLYYAVAILENIVEARVIRDMNNQLRHDLYLSLSSTDHTAYSSHDTGEYLSWLTTNIKQIERLAWGPFFNSVNSIAGVICNIAALFSLHWIILAAGLLSAGIMLVLPNLSRKWMEQLGEACASAESRGLSSLQDLLSGFEVLRSFGRTERFLRQGNTAGSQIEKANCRRTCVQSFISLLTGYIGNIMTLFQMVIAVILAFQGKVILGALVGATNLTSGIVGGLQNTASYQMSMASARPYFKNITVHAKKTNRGPAADIPPIKDSITIEGLSFRYGEKAIFDHLTMTFRKGGKYALTGPSGCGKSTLLKLILGWLPDYQGSIRFDGKDVKDFTPDQLQRQMSYIEQDVFLFNSTIRDNITLGGTFTGEQMEKALRDSALIGDLASLPDGLDTVVGEEGSNLSGGQKQRVAIARALIHDRSILLVDEDTSALDQKNADIVEKSLLDNPELTLILVSHHLAPERRKQFTQVFELHPVAA